MKPWYLYILECSDKTLYTGITVDLTKRLRTHNQGTGSRYTRSKLPVNLVFSAKFKDRSAASAAEFRVKKLTRRNKQKLICGDLMIDDLL